MDSKGEKGSSKKAKPEKKAEKLYLEKRFVIENRLGLHARPAALFVQTANRFSCDIEVRKGSEKVNGKSIMGIMMLAAGMGSSITVRATGQDAEEALVALAKLVEDNFDEKDKA